VHAVGSGPTATIYAATTGGGLSVYDSSPGTTTPGTPGTPGGNGGRGGNAGLIGTGGAGGEGGDLSYNGTNGQSSPYTRT